MFRKVYNIFKTVWSDIKESDNRLEYLVSDIDENEKI